MLHASSIPQIFDFTFSLYPLFIYPPTLISFSKKILISALNIVNHYAHFEYLIVKNNTSKDITTRFTTRIDQYLFKKIELTKYSS